MTEREPSHDAEAGGEEIRDMGFGSTVARERDLRLVNRDGTFNVARHGLPFFRSVTIYELLHRMSWSGFYALIAAAYLGATTIFALAFLASGPDALQGTTGSGFWGRFADSFFFSVHTITTVGYGHVVPAGIVANILVAVEALVGLGGFAVAAGLVFARLARPTANIVFSETAVIAPYGEGTAFEFRIANGLRRQLVDVSARVAYTRIELVDGQRSRQFYPLELERHHIAFFPLHWTVVHPIDESSPLFGVGPSACVASEAEFLVQVSGRDEIFSETVHARSSYRADEIVWGARFADIFERSPGGEIAIDLRRIHEVEELDQGVGPAGAVGAPPAGTSTTT